MRTPATLWLCTQPTDMRRSYDGLAAMVRRELGSDPLSGQGFVFVNRRRTQLKCLYFEAGGYCVWSKRLEAGRFGINRTASSPAVALSHTAFEGLIEGLDLVIKKHRKRWHPGVSRALNRV
ncbi:IS66 family insertion sequence element accessory protein TnpB [Endozoicomonas sp. G2_2]|uniref:IS66 family insertion sequence element accessory protein TnpB n=1 Tax=Endozoicomonas sp. G2_2 TaxID=2821092 RepID=UPI001ADB0B21|nr:IS66 family insertion sequence element accessory protein TnpB [Endozoicomonas sp. G2_2]MBO9471628.1 IS66 family insertion sequence element accessory protein TnpB [Endozoicomonas sp. G2_2]MBO9471645.1 IS66 family insertion sequence element accessory protein TnpB [Endozoicomonas sp. G2_2]